MAIYKTRTIDGKLIEDVKALIARNDSQSLMKLIDDMMAADVADLVEHLEPGERIFIIKILEPEGAGEVLIEIEPSVQERILKDLDNQAISDIVGELYSDDAADVIGDLPAKRAKEIIHSVDTEFSGELEKLLTYDDDTAGGIMALEFISVNAEATLKDAIETIREKSKDVENLYYLWVVDSSGVLVGVISLKDLLLEHPDRRVNDVMNPEVISVHVDADQEEVIQLVKKYGLVHIPVVDNYHCIVGRITHDDIIDVIEDETDEDISLMAGVISEEVGEESSFRISKARLPWLILGLFGEMVSASIIYHFQPTLELIIALSFFFPVIMAMGGNTGTQAATIVVRGLATGDVTLMNISKRLYREMRVGLINGLVCGGLLGTFVSIWLPEHNLGFIVAVALLLIIVNAGLIGAAVPLLLKKLDIDPAIATGPFVSTLNDILGLLIYLGLVSFFLKNSILMHS